MVVPLARGGHGSHGPAANVDRIFRLPTWRTPVTLDSLNDECRRQLELLDRRVVVVASSRSGSEYLSWLMLRLGIDCEEYLNPRSTVSRGRSIQPDQSPAAFILSLCERSSNRVFATKGGIHTLGALFGIGEFPENIRRWHFIHLYRRDVVRQAISLLLAEQTGQWRHDIEAVAVPDRDALTFRVCAARIDQILEARDAATRFFSAFSITPLEIAYEDLIAEPDGILSRVAMFVGLERRSAVPSRPAPQSQSTDLNRELELAFRTALERIILEKGGPSGAGAPEARKASKTTMEMEMEMETAARAPGLEAFALLPPFELREGKAWIAPIPDGWKPLPLSDRAAMNLFENDRALGPRNAMEADIRSLGGGRYATWPNSICFSTSDGSDPNVNERHYSLALLSIEPKVVAAPADISWIQPERAWGCAVVGLGARGSRLAEELSRLPGIDVRWLVDTAENRLSSGRDRLALQDAAITTDFRRALDDPSVNAVFIAVPDFLHRDLAVAAFDAGKHVFLEKPVATTIADAWSIMRAWRRSDRILQLGYVLRDAPFYGEVRRVIEEGLLGRIHSVVLVDHLGLVHGASYMRRWHRDSSQSGGLMVHKGCHDLDLICWLLDARPTRLSSFGGLSTFGRSAPASNCSKCPEEATCPYRAKPAGEPDICVFGDDKDIVDNQTVNFELNNGVRGTFTLAMGNPDGSQRHISIFGEKGKLEGDFQQHRLSLSTVDGKRTRWSVADLAKGGHGGGDRRLLIAFLDACLGRRPAEVDNEVDAMRGLALAAEQSRRSGKVVMIDDDLEILPAASG